MANPYIWGTLNRAVNDPTLIDEAIGEAVAAHNDDPDAHLGPTQALQSHRAAEIIDHLAESVVNDKIKSNARTYIAIVDNTSDADFATVEDACDYAFSKGGGSIFVRRGTYTPTRPLKVRSGVDIYGDGPNETVIDLSGQPYSMLNFAGDVEISCTPIPTIYTYEDSDVIEMEIDPSTNPEDYIGIGLDLPEGFYYIDGWIGGTSYYISDLYPVEDIYTDVVIEPMFDADTSSDIITVPLWPICQGLELGEGLLVTSDEGDLGYYDSYLGDGQIKLTANSLINVTSGTGLQFYAEGGKISILQSISIKGNASDPCMKVDTAKGRVFVRDCIFHNVTDVVWTSPTTYTANGAALTCETTRFIFTTGNVSLKTRGAFFRQCSFNFSAASSCTELGGENSIFLGCNFSGGLSTGNGFIAWIRRTTRFTECTFGGILKGNVANTGSYQPTDPAGHVRFIGCSIVNSTGGNVLFNGACIEVTGCYIYTTGSNSVGLATGAKYATFVGNSGRGTVAAQPANCLVANNLFVTAMS